MGIMLKLTGIVCFLAVPLYWYFVPYQVFLALLGLGNAAGPLIAYALLLLITGFTGVVITIWLIGASFALFLVD